MVEVVLDDVVLDDVVLVEVLLRSPGEGSGLSPGG